MPILALGVSYRRASVDLLERLAFPDEAFEKAYDRLRGLEDVAGAVLLSTCNRVEVYAEVSRYHQGFQDLKTFLADAREVSVEEFADPLYAHYEDQAAEHLFSVAAGIDSMVLGEPQILSQVRAAMKRAEEEGASGASLGSLFRQAVRVGRRARAETDVGASPAAFVEAGAALAQEHLGGLEGRRALVLGAGKMSALAVDALRERGVGQVRVLNRTPERARRLASRVGAEHGGLDALEEGLRWADLVVASTGATGIVVDAAAAGGALDGRPVFFLDLAVPRDVDPGVREVPGAVVADIDDLRGVLEERRAGVEAEVAKVRAIVEEETRRFRVRQREARLAPLITALLERGEEVRARELRRMASRLAGLSERDREAVEALTRGIVNTLLHDPIVRVKELSGPGGEAYARALAELFELEPEG